jgi:hypothetical protein
MWQSFTFLPFNKSTLLPFALIVPINHFTLFSIFLLLPSDHVIELLTHVIELLTKMPLSFSFNHMFLSHTFFYFEFKFQLYQHYILFLTLLLHFKIQIQHISHFILFSLTLFFIYLINFIL